MERDHHQPPARPKHALGGGERIGQLVQLAIDEDAQRLKGARRRMDGLVAPAADGAGDDIGEFERAGERFLRPRPVDGRGDQARLLLFAEHRDDPRQRLPLHAVDHVGGGRPVGAHAHVERALAAEGEAALRRFDLHGGDADIEHDAVDPLVTVVAGDLVERREAALGERQPATGRAFERGAAGNRRGIAVDGDDMAAAGKDGGRVAARSEGAVDIDATGAGREEVNNLLKHHRDVAGQSASGVGRVNAAARLVHSPVL